MSFKNSSFIDKMIFVFITLFLISLTNSIFVNQLGYYGALILILIKYGMTKKNPFSKLGIEIPLLLFVVAEIVSTIFSINQPQSFHNLLKRVLLLPVIYTMVASADSPEKIKLLFKIYITAALLTVAAYIIFAYDHFLSQLYRIEAKGPSPFQYVMTAGGLISFTCIYLFSFIINEKQKSKIKIALIGLLVIAFMALFASYTRAAWLGTASGLMIILLFKKKWITVSVITVGVILVFLLSEKVSEVIILEKDNEIYKVIEKIETPGRASSVIILDGKKYIADYESGLSEIDDHKIRTKVNTPGPLVSAEKWGNNIIGVLSDYRIISLNKSNDLKLTQEFYTPGKTYFHKVKNNHLYVADIDSGLIVFDNPIDNTSYTRNKNIKSITWFDLDSSNLVAYNRKLNKLVLYKIQNSIPTEITDTINIKTNKGQLWLYDNIVYFIGDEGLQTFSLNNGKLNKLQSDSKINNVFNLRAINDSLLVGSTTQGIIFEFKIEEQRVFEYNELYKTNTFFANFLYTNENLIVTRNKVNRISSIIDPNHNTNIERLKQWKTGFRILKDYPLFGVGDIDLHNLYREYKEKFEKETFGHLHNNYVHILVILGVFGFIVISYLFIKIYLLNVRVYQAVKDKPFFSSISLGTLGTFTAFLVSGLAEWNFGDHEIITMVWFSVGMNLAIYKQFVSSDIKKSLK